MGRPRKIRPSDAINALLRQSLEAFTHKTFLTVSPGDDYLPNWHIGLMCEYLEACWRREITRLIINIPPRYMKSITASVAWPAWMMGHDPRTRVLAASYSDKLSLKHSVDTRLVMQSPWYRRTFAATKLAGDQNEKSKFQTTARGHRIATSVGGTATGEGGDYLLVDDPVNPKQAASETLRTTANDWFDQTFSSRLNDKKTGVIVVVMQRLHQEDLSGHLLERGGWEHLCIPAVAEERTVVDFGRVRVVREVGDILHPEREGPVEIEGQKLALTPYGFAGQYQQRPAPAGGGMIKLDWFHRFDLATMRPRTHDDHLTLSFDTAYKPGELNDPSVCEVWLKRGTDHYLLDVWRDRVGYPALKKRALRLCEDWHPETVLVEDKASGQSLIQELREDTSWPVVAVEPGSFDKVVRMDNEAATISAGHVWLPESAPWLADFEDEIMLFPNGANDDQVDAMSQYLKHHRLHGFDIGIVPVSVGQMESARADW